MYREATLRFNADGSVDWIATPNGVVVRLPAPLQDSLRLCIAESLPESLEALAEDIAGPSV